MNPDVFRNLDLILGMEKLIPYFNANDTYVVSSRWQKVRLASIERITEVGLMPKDIIFTTNKAKAVKDNKLDLLIEDQQKYVEPVLKSTDAWVLMPKLSYNQKFRNEAYLKNYQVVQYKDADELSNILKHFEKFMGGTNGSKKR